MFKPRQIPAIQAMIVEAIFCQLFTNKLKAIATAMMKAKHETALKASLLVVT
jgi:hypothetical protein